MPIPDGGPDAPKDMGTPDMGRDVTPDAAPDMAPPADGKNDVGVDMMAAACPANQACKLPGGGDGLCKNNVCSACAENATDDANCDRAYTGRRVCLAGKCIPGNCRTSAQCMRNAVCLNNNCEGCTSDTRCHDDAVYGNATICINPGPNGQCVTGDCHDSSDCGGRICNDNHLCVSCTTDSQCADDPQHPNTICKTAAGAGQGTCVAEGCNTENLACVANAADFCCSATCVPGNCCTNAQCSGATPICTNHRCVAQRCEIVGTSNAFVVDPVNGSDADSSTGSGKAADGSGDAGCRSKTLTHALALVGNNPAANTTVTIIGGTGVALTGETFPFQVRANTKITTSTGAVSVNLTANAIGFRIIGNNASLAPANDAVLTIIGHDTSGAGVLFALGAASTASIQNVAINNTGLDSIQVTGGTVNIGRNVKVTAAGSNAAPASGLDIAGGTVTISNTDATGPVVFSGNHEMGIDVNGTAILNVTATPAADAETTGNGTVVLKDNFQGNLRFKQTPGGQAMVSSILGLVSFGTPAGVDAVEIGGGSRISVRGSVILKSGGNGIIVSEGGTAAGKAVGAIDLGTVDNGNNVLQVAAAANTNPNGHDGLCLDIDGPTGKLSAIGNRFGGGDCRQANQTLTLRADCDGTNQDIGAQGTTLVGSFDVLECLLVK